MATKVICPKCGAEIAIAEHQHVTIGMVIGKDSNLGTVELPLADEKGKKSKAQLRIDAMRAAGMDVSKFFCMKDSKGEETMVGTYEGGEFALIDTDDPIVNKIVEAGSLSNAHLFKQHVLAQILKMMTRLDYNYNSETYSLKRNYRGKIDMSYYTDALNRMGYGYSWTVLRDELKRQAAMEKHHDTKCLAEDTLWYNREVAVAMFDHHHAYLEQAIDKLKVRHFNGMPYVNLRYVDRLLPKKKSNWGYVYTTELETLKKNHWSYRKAISHANNSRELYIAVMTYMDAALPHKLRVRPSDLKQGERIEDLTPCEAWKNAYKGYGGYFAMQNLIMFHGCRITVPKPGKDGWTEKVKLSRDASLKQLDKWAQEHKDEGYWLLGALKQLIAENGFNIERKRAEWYANKCNR